MKIVDVTLRDGGFCNDFNWSLDYAAQHYKLISDMKLHYCELGYWKQSQKSNNAFYNLNENLVDRITSGVTDGSDVIAMIDYHYCSKNLDDYPVRLSTPLTMLRITSRKEDLDEALVFTEKLRDKTKLDLSFQIINSTNYSSKELTDVMKKIIKVDLEVVSFADSHGNLNLLEDWIRYEESIEILNENNIKTGFHLHNHTGRALTNYLVAVKKGINILDASIKGLGKGAGNLRLEEILINEYIVILLEYMLTSREELIKLNYDDALNIITGRLNITDNYTKNARKSKLTLEEFWWCCKKIQGVDKDSYNSKLFETIEKNLLKNSEINS